MFPPLQVVVEVLQYARVEFQAGAHEPPPPGGGVGVGVAVGVGVGVAVGVGVGVGAPLTFPHSAGTLGGSQPTCEVWA